MSLQNVVNKFFSAVGEVWRVVTASAYRQARQKVQPAVFVHLNAVACEEYYARYGADHEVAVWHATPRTSFSGGGGKVLLRHRFSAVVRVPADCMGSAVG